MNDESLLRSRPTTLLRSSKMRGKAIRYLPAVALGVLALFMIWSFRQDGAVTTSKHVLAYAELCRADAAADAGDYGNARARFFDVHTPLHEVATAVAASDRASAAHLLETKADVEAAATAERPLRMDPLVVATRRAVAAIEPDPGPCSNVADLAR